MKFLDLFNTHEVALDQKEATISYLKQEYPATSVNETNTATRFNLKVKELNVKLKRGVVNTKCSQDQLYELSDKYNVNYLNDHIKPTLKNEQLTNIQKQVFNQCKKVAQYKSKYELNPSKGHVTGIRRFFWDLLNYHPELQLQDMSIENSDFEIALNRMAHKIAQDSRQGPGNFIIVSPKAATRFTNSNVFVHVASQRPIKHELFEHIGTFKYLDVFVSHAIKDNEILMGRKPRDVHEPSVGLVKTDDDYALTDVVDAADAKTQLLASLTAFWNVYTIPGAEDNYITWGFQYDKPSLRTHILKSLKLK